jgi:Ca2+-binding EF-hand superfamily protein
LRYVGPRRWSLTDEEAQALLADAREQLHAAFQTFDLDRNGRLDLVEFRSALRALGHEVDEEEALRLIASVDTDGSRTVTFDGFVRLVVPRPVGLDVLADLREAFDLLDVDGDGRISRQELRRALERHGESAQQVDAIFAAAKADQLDFDGFADLMSRG